MAAVDAASAPAPDPERKRDRARRHVQRFVRVPLAVRTGDLPKRAASAVVMLAIAGGALWAGGGWWQALVAVVAFGVLWEWMGLARRLSRSPLALFLWCAVGVLYVFAAGWTLLFAREQSAGYVLLIAGAVIATDVGAYFAGRTIGGPKIAPRISPSKTWAGLAGGALAATVFLACFVWASTSDQGYLGYFIMLALAFGPLCAIVAQAGDFFESWMKRKAGVKDSGHLLPGHGGLFDRVDGLMAVSLVLLPFAWSAS